MSVPAWLRRYWRPSTPPESSRSADGVGSPRRPASSSDNLASSTARRLRRGLSSALLCVPLLAPLATGAAAQTMVPGDWPLKPSGLSAGNQFRLMFLTSTTRNATSSNIADYNSFVQTRAAAGHTSIRSYSAQFRVVGSTAAVDARDNTSTTGAGVAIYWLGGAKVANNNADFYDGTWATPVGRDESGTSIASNTVYYTGSKNDGTEAFFGTSTISAALGSTTAVRGTVIQGLSSGPSGGDPPSTTRSLLALSPVFEVGQPNQLSIGAKSYLVTEGGTVSVTLNLRNWERPSATTVGITCTAGTAGSADYTCPATVTVPANTRSHTFTIQTTADTVDEFPETFTVAIGTVPTGVRKGAPSSATVTIVGGGYTKGNFHFKAWDGRSFTVISEDGLTTDTVTEIDRIASSGHVREGNSITYMVERGQKFGAASVDYETMDISAKAPGDYTHVSGTLNFAHGDTSKTITIETVCDDVDHEGAEQFWLILSNPTGGYSLTSTNRYYPHRSRVVIGRVPVDECPTSSEQVLPGGTPSEVTIAADRTSVTEGGDVTFTVTADPAPAHDLVVNVSADEEMGSDGNLVAGGHSGTVTIWAGTASATWTVTTMSDDDALADGTVTGRIVSGDGYTVDTPSEVTVTLLDDDGLQIETQSEGDSVVTPAVDPALVAQVRGYAAETWKHPDHVKRWKQVLAAFGDDNGYTAMTAAEAQTYADRGWQRWVPVAAALTALEAAQQPLTLPAVSVSAGADVTEGGDAVFTVTANPAPAAALTVSVTVAAEGDYGITAGTRTVSIPAAGSATLTLATTGDDADEADGSVTATVNAGEGYTVGSPASGTVAIADDDLPPAVATVDPALVAQVRGYAAETHQGQAHVDRWKRVLAAFGDDNGYTPMTAAEARTHADKGWQRWVPVAAALAALEAPPETLPAVTVSAGADVTEGGDAVFTVTANPAPAAELSVTVTVAASGEFGVTAGTQTVPIPTTGSAVLTLATANDEADEPDGSVSVTVAAGNGYTVGDPASGTVAIADDDAPLPVVSIAATAASVTEGGAAAFTLTADRAPEADLPVTLAVAETGDGDHVAADDEGPATAVIAKGTTTAVFSIATVDDDAHEPDGAVTVTLTAGEGYTVAVAPGDAATGTVTDNDAVGGAVLSVADAEVTEGEGLPVMVFTVSLSAPAPAPVRVFVSTRPSTPVSAIPKVDYAPASYALPFRAGQTEKQVYVRIYDDSHDEDPETFEVVLSQARGAAIGDGVAVGTIVNSDPMPAAWLARFGRTVAQQALDGIAGRLAAPRTPGAQGTLAGQAFTLRPRGATPDAPAAGTSLLAGLAAQVLPTLPNGGLGAGPPSGFDPGAPGRAGIGGPAASTLTLRDILLGSSFTATGQPDAHGGSVAFWGRAAQATFEGREGTFALDGETTTAMLGTDYARDRWLLGVTLLQSLGTGGYDDRDATPAAACATLTAAMTAALPAGLCNGAVREGAGAVESTLTAAVPYAAFQASEHLKLWGAAGYGVGEVTLAPETGGTLKTDIAWTMAEVGLRGTVLAPPPAGTGPTLAVTSDALWARTTSEQVRHGLAASNSAVTRLRLGLEGQWPVVLETLGQLTPTLAVGARHDGGEAETGFGVELGGGLAWTAPQFGLALTLEGRTLLTHRDEDFQDQGVAAAFTFDPDPTTPRGPSVTLRQDWGGQATGGVDALFAADPLTQRQGTTATQSRWAAEAAWGFPAFGGRFTGSPHVGVGLAPGTRDYRLGWRLVSASPASALSLALQATRRELDAAPPEHTVGLELSTQW